MAVKPEDFLGIEIEIHKLEDQQKIGSFLSTIDELLEIYIKEADSTFKIGRYIINKIFKDEKGFNSSKETKNSEWKKVRLADISTLITKGTTPSYYTENGVKFVKVESIENETINFKKINYIDGKTHSSVLNRSQLQENDILFSIAGTLGRKVIVENSMLPANTNQALAIIRVDSNKADFNYINSNLHEEKIKNFIKENVTTGAQPNLSLKQISSFSIELPPLEEQVKISNLDSLFKKLFKFQRERNEFLKKYKKHYLYTIFSTKEQ
jgi:type I restriction enzyme S subunit